jgi:hypothetical protein
VEVVVARTNFFSPAALGARVEAVGREVAAGLEQALTNTTARTSKPISFITLLVFISFSLSDR